MESPTFNFSTSQQAGLLEWVSDLPALTTVKFSSFQCICTPINSMEELNSSFNLILNEV